MLRELRSVIGLQKLLYVIFGIQDFTVNTVVWEIPLVAVVLRGTAADSEFCGELRIGHETFASEQGVITFPQILTFGGDVVRDGVEALYALLAVISSFMRPPFLRLSIRPHPSP